MSFVSLDSKWSHECPFCFCLHLYCTVREERKQCCSNGKMVRDANKEKFRLKPFSMEYLQVLLDNTVRMIFTIIIILECLIQVLLYNH